MTPFRYFPFLGFKELDHEEKVMYGLPTDFTFKNALVAEWLHMRFLVYAKGYKLIKDDDGN